MEHDIIIEMAKLLEKSGIENATLFDTSSAENNSKNLETSWINIKALNARYDKSEALNQVQWLMNKYNIQIDELMEGISS
jgi:hypothetical protein